jgi:hypothetical protein
MSTVHVGSEGSVSKQHALSGVVNNTQTNILQRELFLFHFQTNMLLINIFILAILQPSSVILL